MLPHGLVPLLYSPTRPFQGLSSDPYGDRMQKLCPRKVDVPTKTLTASKAFGVSSSRVMFRISFNPCLMLKGLSASF